MGGETEKIYHKLEEVVDICYKLKELIILSRQKKYINRKEIF
jgi:hypothetical protein